MTSMILNPYRFGAAADPGLTLLQGATMWLDASDVTSGSQWVRNKGAGSRALDARFGSVGQNQVIKGALKMVGTSSAFSTPDSAALDPVNLDIVWRLQLDDYTPASQTTLFGKYELAVSGSWLVRLNTDGTIVVTLRSQSDWTSTAAFPLTDKTAYWMRISLDDTNNELKFYYAADQEAEPSSWTQVGTTVAYSGVIGNSTVGLDVNGMNGGTMYRFILKNGIGGTPVFDADFSGVADLATSFTESSSNAATVTINSTSGVDTNDPLLLTHTGTNYLYLPGIASNNASAPDNAAYTPASEMEVIIRVQLDDYTPSTKSALVSHDASFDASWTLGLTTAGNIEWLLNNGPTYTSSAVPPFTDGTGYWIRAIWKASDFARFYYAADQSSVPSSWTQVGTDQATTSAVPVNAVTTLKIMGGAGSSTHPGLLAGRVYRAILRTTIGGSAVFDADFTANTNQSSFTESSSNAATVTINRATSGRKAVMVTRPTWLFGTDDYMEVPDNNLLDMGATDPFTVLVVGRAWGTQGTNDALVAKKADVTNTTAGYLLSNHGTTALQLQGDIGDGTNGVEATSASRVAGERKIWAMVRSVASDNLTTYINTTAGTSVTDTSTATLANAEVLRVGRLSGAGTEYADVEIDAVVVVKGTAYDATQLGQIATYYGV